MSQGFAVIVGAPASPSNLPPLPLVVVEASIERAKSFRDEVAAHDPAAAVQVCSEVLASAAGEQLTWNLYNDPRLDGCFDLEHWRASYPNARLIAAEKRESRTLAQVLDAWAGRAGQEAIQLQEADGVLLLRQGDPLAVLAGSGPWLVRFAEIVLQLPQSESHWAEALNHWLEPRGFSRREGALPLCWERDPQRLLQLESERLSERCMELEEQLSAQAVQLLLAQDATRQLQEAHQGLVEERESLRSANAELAHATQALQQELATTSAEIEAILDLVAAEAEG
jgi:hypothetical protein